MIYFKGRHFWRPFFLNFKTTTMRYLLFFLLPFQLIAQNLETSIKYLALGDSYTIGQSVDVELRWPNQLSDTLNKLGYTIIKNDILATTGWTTENLHYGLKNSNLDRDYNLVSLLIGVNNFYQGRPVNQFRKELPELIDSALNYCNQDRNALFLVTIPDYGYTPFGKGSQASISQNTNLYNGIVDSVAQVYGIPVFNITPISRRGIDEPNLVANDGLHPSGKQYKLWVDLMIQKILYPTSINILKRVNVNYSIRNEQVDFTALNTDGFIQVFNTSGKLLYMHAIHQMDPISINLSKGVNFIQFISPLGNWSKIFLR